MAQKRGREGASGSGSKKAKALPAPGSAPAPVSKHPTAEFVSDFILRPLQAELNKLSQTTAPKDYAGLRAFSKEDFKENMVKHSEYECNLRACDHRLGDFDHLVPIGSIVRMSKHSFYDDETKQPRAAPVTHAVVVRAVSAIDPDANGKEPVGNMSYLLSFMLAWAQCKKLGIKAELAKFFEHAQMIRTRFILLPDKDEFERKKWSLQESTKELSEQTVLYGISRVLAVADVRDDLALRKQSCDHVAVSAWFSTVKVSSASEKITSKTAQTYLRIHARFETAIGTVDACRQMDNHLGKNHALASTSVLEICVGRTSCPSNTALEAKLLTWVVEGLAVQTLRKNLPSNSKEGVKDILPLLLLQRRCVTYIASKYPFADEDGVTYAEGRSPSKIFKEVFGTYKKFHDTFPKGNKLEFKFTSLDDGQPQQQSSSVDGLFLWIGQLAELQQEMVSFLRAFLDFRADIVAIANRALSSKKDISAESFLSMQDFVDGQILQMNVWTEEYSKMLLSEQKQPEPASQTPVSVLAQPQPAASTPPLDEIVPGDAEEEKPIQPNTVRHFPHLVLPQPVVDVLDSVSPERFDNMVSHARQRWSKHVELVKAPADSTQWGASVLSTQLMQTVGAKDRISFVYDSKNMSDTLVVDRIMRPFKHPATFQIQEFSDILSAVFGDPSQEAEVRINGSPFMWKGSASMFQVFDGRRPASTSKITGQCNKVLKHVPPFRGSVLPLRLMYSNKEFRTNHPPEPLETAVQIFSKNFKVNTRGRMFIDLPGTNQTRGLNSIPFKEDFDIQVKYWFKTAILGGVGGVDNKEDVVDLDFLAEDSGEDGPAESAIAATAADDSQRMDMPVRIFPWSFVEKVPREFLNMYQPTGVVLFGGGAGSWMLACARHGVRCVAFCKTDDHMTFLDEVLTVRVAMELIEGKNDGFKSRRFLSREVSLGGHSEASSATDGAPSEAASAATAAEPPTPAAAAPTPSPAAAAVKAAAPAVASAAGSDSDSDES